MMQTNNINKSFIKQIKSVVHDYDLVEPCQYNLQISITALYNLALKYQCKYHHGTLMTEFHSAGFTDGNTINKTLKIETAFVNKVLPLTNLTNHSKSKDIGISNHLNNVEKKLFTWWGNYDADYYQTDPQSFMFSCKQYESPFFIFSKDSKVIKHITLDDFYYLADTFINTLKFAPVGYMMSAHARAYSSIDREIMVGKMLQLVINWCIIHHKTNALSENKVAQASKIKDALNMPQLYSKSEKQVASEQLKQNTLHDDVVIVTNIDKCYTREPKLADIDKVISDLKPANYSDQVKH